MLNITQIGCLFSTLHVHAIDYRVANCSYCTATSGSPPPDVITTINSHSQLASIAAAAVGITL